MNTNLWNLLASLSHHVKIVLILRAKSILPHYNSTQDHDSALNWQLIHSRRDERRENQRISIRINLDAFR